MSSTYADLEHRRGITRRLIGAFITIFAGLALVVLRVGYGLVDTLMAVDRLVTVLQDRPGRRGSTPSASRSSPGAKAIDS